MTDGPAFGPNAYSNIAAKAANGSFPLTINASAEIAAARSSAPIGARRTGRMRRRSKRFMRRSLQWAVPRRASGAGHRQAQLFRGDVGRVGVGDQPASIDDLERVRESDQLVEVG